MLKMHAEQQSFGVRYWATQVPCFVLPHKFSFEMRTEAPFVAENRQVTALERASMSI